MNQETIDVMAVSAVTSGLESAGYCLTDILAQSGIPLDCLALKNHRLPSEAFVQLAKNIIAETDDEGLCLFPRRIKTGAFVTAGRLAVHCPDLKKSLRRIVEFYNILDFGAHFSFEEQHKEAVFKITMTGGQQVKNPVVIEIYMTAIHRFLSWLVGQTIVVKRLKLAEALSARRDAYQRTFACEPIISNVGENSLSFSTECLALPIVRTERAFLEFACQHAAYLFEPVGKSRSMLSMRVQSYIAESLETYNNVPELDDLEGLFGMSGRSIAAQLRREGLRFRDVVSLVRRDMALRYVSDSKLSFEEIASKTGYSELSAFSRAFKAWTALPPQDYRKRGDMRVHNA